LHVYGPQIIMILEKSLPDDLLHKISLSILQKGKLTDTINDFYNCRRKYVSFLGRSVIAEWPRSRDEYNQYISELNLAYNALKKIELLYDKKLWMILTENQKNIVLNFLAEYPSYPKIHLQAKFPFLRREETISAGNFIGRSRLHTMDLAPIGPSSSLNSGIQTQGGPPAQGRRSENIGIWKLQAAWRK